MRILIEHLRNVADTLRLYSKQCGFADNSDNSGGAREALCRLFMQQHLPQSVSFFTGELFDQADARSGQIDLIIHPIGSPRLNLIDNIDLVYADAVLATIEVKSSLTTATSGKPSHLKAALDSCVKIKRLVRTSSIGAFMSGSGQPVTLTKVPVLIFAFEGPTVETLRAKLHEYQTAAGVSLDLMPDLITVLVRDYYIVQNNGWLIDKVENEKVHWSHNAKPEAVLLGMYVYLTKLIEANEAMPEFTPFSKYLGKLTTNA
jgi:Domain of unknown function (DUF6602)